MRLPKLKPNPAGMPAALGQAAARLAAPRHALAWLVAASAIVVLPQAQAQPRFVAHDQPQETVTLGRGSHGRGRLEVRGEVLEFTGSELRLRLDSGKELRYPGREVLAIATRLAPVHLEAERHYQQRRWNEAATAFEQALGEGGETRRWVRRQIVARLVDCQRETKRLAEAGEFFLLLVRSDPATPYYCGIPLAWSTEAPDERWQATAAGWMARDDLPAATLLGASHLLATPQRPAAEARLRELTGHEDRRIAALATAQLWRFDPTPVLAVDELRRRAAAVDAMPCDLRAGPYLELGRGWLAAGEPMQATLALLRVPIHFSAQQELASLALDEAARALASAGHEALARSAERELAWRFPRAAADPAAAAAPRSAPVPLAAALADELPLEIDEAGFDRQFLTGLRLRSMYPLVQAYCEARLAEQGLEPRRRIDLVVEQSQALVDEALATSPAERPPLWSQALDVVRNFVADHPREPRLLVARTQGARVMLARGESLREQLELAGEQPVLATDTRDALRAAARELAQLQDLVSAERRNEARGLAAVRAAWADNELATLERNLKLAMARAWRNLGQAHPPQSAARVDALMQARQACALLAQGAADDPLVWPARIEELICARLADDHAAAGRLFEACQSQQPPPEFAAALEAEAVRFELAKGRLDEARGRLARFDHALDPQAAEWHLARIEVLVASARAARRSQQAELAAGFQSDAQAALRRAGDLLGTAWLHRAEVLVSSEILSGGAAESLGSLLEAADGLYRAQRWDEARDAYDRTGQLARSRRDSAAAFNAFFRAAAIEHQLERHAAARDRFRTLALDLWEHPQAGEAHLAAVFHAARLVDPEVPATRADYAELLDEHLRIWSDQATAGEVRWQLGRLAAEDQDWPLAVEHYTCVGIEQPRFEAALRAAAEAARRWQAAEVEQGGDFQQFGQALAQRLASPLEVDGAGPAAWQPAQRAGLLIVAPALLGLGGAGVPRASALVETALADRSAPDDWRRQVLALAEIAAVVRGEKADSRALAAILAPCAASQRIALLEHLALALDSAAPEPRAALASAMLAIAESLEADGGLSAEEQQRCDRASARALAAAGRLDEAPQRLAALADDADLREQQLRQVMGTADASALAGVLAEARRFEARCRPGSARWFRARLLLAEVYRRQGRSELALKLIAMTEALYPALGGADTRRQFRELAAACRR